MNTFNKIFIISQLSLFLPGFFSLCCLADLVAPASESTILSQEQLIYLITAVGILIVIAIGLLLLIRKMKPSR